MMTNLFLLILLILITLPIAVVLFREIMADMMKKEGYTEQKNVAGELEHLIKSLSTTVSTGSLHWWGSITHFIKLDHGMGNTFFYDGRAVSEGEDIRPQRLPNDFIKYSEHQWVNSHWIEKIGPDSLELHNGAEISKLE